METFEQRKEGKEKEETGNEGTEKISFIRSEVKPPFTLSVSLPALPASALHIFSINLCCLAHLVLAG